MNQFLNTSPCDGWGNSSMALDSESFVIENPLVSEEARKICRLVFVGLLALAVCCLGIPTNALSCLVFRRQGLRDRMNLCLFYLSLVDMGWLLFTLPFSVVTIFIDLSLFGVTDEHYWKVCLYSIGVGYAFRATSGCYNVLIAVERCVCVMFPLRASSLMTTKTMGMTLSAIALILQVGFITLPLRHQVVGIEINGKVVWHLGLSTVWENHKHLLDIIFVHILSVILPLTTFFLVLAATLATVIKLRLALQWRETTSSTCGDKQRHQMALTKTLVLVSGIYIVTTAPFVISKIVSLLFADFAIVGRYTPAYDFVLYIANVVSLINACVNFFVYRSRSSRFRRELKCTCFGISRESVASQTLVHDKRDVSLSSEHPKALL